MSVGRPIEDATPRRDIQHRCRCGHPRGDHSRNEGECLDDACSCVLFVQRGTFATGTRAIGTGRRKHPPPKNGDRFGPYRVVRVLPRGYRGRSDLRVEVKCTCGRYSDVFEFNLRKVERHAKCPHDRSGE